MTFAQQFSLWATYPVDPDTPLLSRALKGDQASFGTLMRKYESLLRGFIGRRVGHDGADDVYQETQIACWAGLARYAGRSRFKAWLFGIAAHKCADFHRSRTQRNWESLESPPNITDESNPYEKIELREVIGQLLERLPDTQREVLELYYYAELTLAETAAALGRNINTVKYQFYRAHDQVADELKCMGIGPK